MSEEARDGTAESGSSTPLLGSSMSAGGTPSAGKIAFWLAAGALLIYLATWLGPVSFYFYFQTQFPGPEELGRESIFWRQPRLVPAVPAPGWRVHDEPGARFPLPPGAPEEIVQQGNVFVVRFPEGTFRVQMLPSGMVASLLLDELRTLGTRGETRPSEVAALHDVLHETPRHFRFSWNERQRTRYAARLLVKMLLWEDRPLRRFELAELEEQGVAGALVEYKSGEVKVISTGPEGTVIVLLGTELPATWKASPALWMAALINA